MSTGCPYVEVTSTNPAIPGGWYVEDENRGYYRLTTFDPTTCVETKLNNYLALKGSGSRDVEWVFSQRTPGTLNQAGQVTHPLVTGYHIYTAIYSDDPTHGMITDSNGAPSTSSFTTFTDAYRFRVGDPFTHIVEPGGSFAFFQGGNIPKTIEDQNGTTRYLHGFQIRRDDLLATSRFDSYLNYDFETVSESTDGTSTTPANIPFFVTPIQLPKILEYQGSMPRVVLPLNHTPISTYDFVDEQFFSGDFTVYKEFLGFGQPNNRPFHALSIFVPVTEPVKEIYPTDQNIGVDVSAAITLNAPSRKFYSSVWSNITELASFPSNGQNLCPAEDYNSDITDVQINRSVNDQNPCTPAPDAPGVPENLNSTLINNTPDAPGVPENLVSQLHLGRPPYNGTTIASKYKGWVFDERTSAISGPFVHEDVTAVATKDNSAEMYCVTENKEVKKTDLLEFNNYDFPAFADPFTDILTPFDGSNTKGIVASETAEGFCYRNKYLSAPFAEPSLGGGTVNMPLYFRDCYLAQSETNWMHLGDEHSEKQCYRVDLRFHKNSCGHIWLYVKNDEGLVKGQYKGAIKEHMKVFTNLRGRSFKIHMLIATHHDHPWAMREMAVGHLYGKSF